jgi:hypothetical protein
MREPITRRNWSQPPAARPSSAAMTQTSERCEAKDGGAGVSAAPAFGAQPEGIAQEAGREGMSPAAAVMHVPQLGVPVAAPFVAIGDWHEGCAGAEHELIGF